MPQLAGLNPRLVYVSANGYGPAGPGALRPSTHPIPGAALGGVLHQVGGAPDTGPIDDATLRETARRLMRANDVNPDPNTSLVICSAALLALTAQRRTGQGQQVFVDMFGTSAYANFDDALRHPGKAPRIARPRRLRPRTPVAAVSVPRGLGVPGDPRRGRMAAYAHAARGCLPRDAADDCADRTRRRCRQHGGAADDVLRRQRIRLGGSPRTPWRGVRAGEAPALPDQFFIDDPQARAEGLVMPALHPQWGAYLRHGAQVILHGASGTHDTLQGATLCGEHTNALLAELGIDADERHALRAARMVA